MATSVKHSGWKRLVDRTPTHAALVLGAEVFSMRRDSTNNYGGLQMGIPTYTAAGCADGAGVSLATGWSATVGSVNRFSAFEVVADTGSTDIYGNTYEAAIHGKLNIGTTQSNASLMAGLFSLDVADDITLTSNYFALRGHLDFWDDCTFAGSSTFVGALSAYVENESTTTVAANTWLIGVDVYQVGAITNSGTNPGINIRSSATAADWQYGIYIRGCTTGVNVSVASTATGKNGILVSDTFTLATAGVHKAIQGDVSYSAGYATPIGVAGKVTLTGAYSGVGYMWGVQGQIQFDTASSLAGSQVAAGRFVLTETGTVTYTSGNIACIYADNLITSPMASESSGNIDLIRIANHGGQMDSAINLYGPNLTNLFMLTGCTTVGCVGANNGGGSTLNFTNYRLITIDIDGTTHYLVAARTIA